MNTQQVQDLIRRIAREENVNADYMLKVAAIESEFNPEAFNPRSGAAGLFQILPMNKVQDVFNPEVNTRWTAKFTRENAQHLNRKGIPVNEETLYLAHQQGREGASIIWNALQSGKNINNLPPQIERNVNANNPRRYTSLRDWYEFWANKMRSMPNPSENPLAYSGRGNTPNNAPTRLPSGSTGRNPSGNQGGYSNNSPNTLPTARNTGTGSQYGQNRNTIPYGGNNGNNPDRSGYGSGYDNGNGYGGYENDYGNGYGNGYGYGDDDNNLYPSQRTTQEADSGSGVGGLLFLGALGGLIYAFFNSKEERKPQKYMISIKVNEEEKQEV
ncbi:MAG: lytic transglycosylase domain-containing protein [Candidatus Kapabacteria bacterium]|jgi:hypothetical protein|nr:lytic transglycosylase domain-containing protein [Candidatus Kapabacteria bacterium]